MNKHEIWSLTIILTTALICFTALILQSQSWKIRFEMDNNTLEAVKSINWSSFNQKINQDNCICTDFNINQHNCCWNSSLWHPNGSVYVGETQR